MEFTLYFFQVLISDFKYASPMLIFLFALITMIGLFIGKIEGWSKSDALYHAFINATTVGYGDFRPSKKLSKLLAVLLALVGLIFTGMILAIALHAADYAYGVVYEMSGFTERLRG